MSRLIIPKFAGWVVADHEWKQEDCCGYWLETLDGAIKLANTYPKAQLICVHWGSVDAPEMTPFNGNPEDLVEKVVNSERIRVLAPGEALRLG